MDGNSDGTWEFDGYTLKLYNEKGTINDEYAFMPDTYMFRSKTQKVVAEQEYVDASGVYHSTVYMIMYRDGRVPGDVKYDISNFSQAVSAYNSIYNGGFPIQVDYSVELPNSFNGVGSCYLVTSHNSKADVMKSLKEQISDELISQLWQDERLVESNGKLYYRFGSSGWVEYDTDISNASLMYITEAGDYVISIGRYASGGVNRVNYLENDMFTFRRFSDGFKIIDVH